MLVDSLFKYLKKFETNIQENEIPEKQFMDIALYKSEAFNLNNFAKIVMQKIEDSNFLIKNLKELAKTSKQEIVTTITNDVNNYVVLISKLQNIDFLIENIDKPLASIKTSVLSEISFIEKYETDLLKILDFIKQNEKQTKIVLITLRFYKYFESCRLEMEQLKQKFLSETKRIIFELETNQTMENIKLINDNYRWIKRFIVEFYNFEMKFETFRRMFDNLEEKSNLYEQISKEEQIIFNLMERLLKVLLSIFSNYDFANNETANDTNLSKNLFEIIINIYLLRLKRENLYEIYYQIAIEAELNKNFDIKNFNALYTLIDKHENLVKNILKDDDYIEFISTCFINPVIEILNQDKSVNSCIDQYEFRSNYLNFKNFISKYIQITDFKKINEKTQISIKNFVHKFSFFTYYQFIQTDILKILTIKAEDNETINLLFNFNKLLESFFKENRIFVKILPNFLSIVFQANKYIIDKCKSIEDIETNNYYINYKYFIASEFKASINKILQSEAFLYNDINDYNNLLLNIEKSEAILLNSFNIIGNK